MTEQDLRDELATLQQSRLVLAAQLDQQALKLQSWDEHIALLQKLLVTLQIQKGQEEKLVQVIAAEAVMKVATPIVQSVDVAKSLGV